jgi:ABC-type phosphonate transport system ATPase subunit
MTAPLLQVLGVGKRFGGFVACECIDFGVAPGERLGVIIAAMGPVDPVQDRLKARGR